MKSDTVKVGSKIGSEHVQVECTIQIPENVPDMKRLAQHDRTEGRMTESEIAARDEFVVQMFTRGWRIWKQEQSGARDVVATSSVVERKDVKAFTAKVQAVIDAADPLAPAKRTGRPAKAAEVKVDDSVKAAMQSGDMNALAALLAAQGIKLNVQ